MAIDLPSGWFDDTPEDAGEISTEGTSDTVEAYRVPDIEASRDFTDQVPEVQDSSWFDVTIGIPVEGLSQATQHELEVTANSEAWEADPGPTRRTTISGYPALTTKATSPASSPTEELDPQSPSSVLVVSTVLTDDYVITIRGYTNLADDPRGDELERLLAAARIV